MRSAPEWLLDPAPRRRDFYYKTSMTHCIITTLVLLIVVLPALYSQEPSKRYEVDKIVFEGNKALKDEELRSILQTRETPNWFWKTLSVISEKIGEKAEYFDAAVFDLDYLMMKKYYLDKGFFHAHIDTSIEVNDKSKRVTLKFQIREGARSLIDTLRYDGLVGVPQDLIQEIETKRLLHLGDPFEKQKVSEEVRRVLSAFLNYGYVNVRIGTPEAFRYTSTNNIKLVFTFTPGARYRFGDIHIVHDTSAAGHVSDAIIFRHIDFTAGDYYSEAKKVESERNLNRTSGESSRGYQLGIARSDFPPTTDAPRTIPRIRRQRRTECVQHFIRYRLCQSEFFWRGAQLLYPTPSQRAVNPRCRF
jgi:outer membrane protein assembly factor BamA